VPTLRAQADVVVLLSHLGNDVDQEIARKVPGIDFIIGAHSHTVVDQWKWVGDTLVAQAGVYGAYLGRIDFAVEKSEKGARITSVNGKNGKSWDKMRHRPLGKHYPRSPLIAVEASTVDDPAAVEAYGPFLNKAEQQLSEVIGQAVEAIPPGPQSVAETPAGNLVADAIRAYAKSDVAVVDTRSISHGLAAGPVKVRDSFDMIGGFTRQQVVVVRMKGSQLSSLLPSKLLEDGALRLQVSGLALTFRQVGRDRAEISNISVGGVPIDPEKDYTIAGQAYIIQGFISRFPGLPIEAEPGGTTREAIVDYIRSQGKINPPGDQRLLQTKT
jgi:2',3'-cyclic-nucleotide 2'-phosphodiesterase (5'-nucleotidase family)